MGLWLEHRDEKGTLIERERFVGGVVSLVEHDLTLQQAVELCKLSAYLPSEKRDWALRIGFGE